MMTSPTKQSLRIAAVVTLSIAVIYATVGGMQPVLDALFGGGTLFATTAHAEDVEPSHGAEVASLDTTTKGDLAQAKIGSSDSIFQTDPVASLALSLQKKQHELHDREAQLEAELRRLEVLEDQIEEKLRSLTALREELHARITKFEADRDSERTKELKRWVEIYQSMQPQGAAQLLAGLPDDLAVQVLSGMEPKKAGKILDQMDGERAIELGENL